MIKDFSIFQSWLIGDVPILMKNGKYINSRTKNNEIPSAEKMIIRTKSSILKTFKKKKPKKQSKKVRNEIEDFHKEKKVIASLFPLFMMIDNQTL